MLKRISKVQKPILKNEEEYQLVQMSGISQLINEVIVATIGAAVSLDLFDQSAYDTVDPDTGNPGISDDMVKKIRNVTKPVTSDVAHVLAAGMQSAAMNYIGLVLTGKMKPIYDGSLDEESRRAETRNSAERICAFTKEELSKLGAVEETEEGKIVISEPNRLF